jgi:AraC family transcriptional regulator of adaptative response/methylated-DNA-[protein]-cysteine methyltransferase
MTTLKKLQIATPLGHMTAIGDNQFLYFLDFSPSSPFETKPGRSLSIDAIERELNLYFEGKLQEFKTPLKLNGTPFQVSVWEKLREIPYGKTYSYAELAAAIGRPTAFRAVAQANGANRFPVLIPCHRVINSGGKLGGYSGGLERKIWLLNHEKKAL